MLRTGERILFIQMDTKELMMSLYGFGRYDIPCRVNMINELHVLTLGNRLLKILMWSSEQGYCNL